MSGWFCIHIYIYFIDCLIRLASKVHDPFIIIISLSVLTL